MSLADEATTVATVSDGSHDATPDGVPQCTAVTMRGGHRCQNPAILGTPFCHGHLDFTALNEERSDDTRPPYASAHARKTD